MFRNTASQRDSYFTNPTEHYLGSFSQEQVPFSQNANSSEMSQPDFGSQNRKFMKDWQSLGAFSNKRMNPSSNKQDMVLSKTVSQPKENESSYILQELRNEAAHRELVEVLHMVLDNQRILAEELKRNGNSELLKNVMNNQLGLSEELKQVSEQNQQVIDTIRTVKSSLSSLDDDVTKMNKCQSDWLKEYQKDSGKQLRELNDKILETAEVYQTQQKKLKELIMKNQTENQNVQKSINSKIDIVSAQDKKLQHLKSDLKGLLEEQFYTFFEEKLRVQLHTLISKFDNTIKHAQEMKEQKEQQKAQWMETALHKLQDMNYSNTGHASPQHRRKDYAQDFHIPAPTPRLPLQIHNTSWKISNCGERNNFYGEGVFKQPGMQSVKYKDRLPPISRNPPKPQSSTKKDKRKKKIHLLPKKIYPLRSYANSCFSPLQRPSTFVPAIDSSPAISFSFSDLHRQTHEVIKKGSHFYNQPKGFQLLSGKKIFED